MNLRDYWKAGIGKKLKKIHAWNAWVVLALAITGLLLYIPSLRGILAIYRVSLKQLHIMLGAISIVLLLVYVPLFRPHLRQLRGKLHLRSNLTLVLLLLVGWSISGIVLAFERFLPPPWTSFAIVLHDLLTWVGVPYVIYHALSRSRWVKTADRRSLLSRQKPELGSTPVRTVPKPHIPGAPAPLSRRKFIRLSLGTMLILAIGPLFYRFLKTVFDTGGNNLGSLTQMTDPAKQALLRPLPDSSPPIGGGARGNFRIYTVTEIPRFNPDRWTFNIGGLVDRPAAYNWKQFAQLTRTVQVSDFHCVTGWSVYSVTWEGISLRKFIEQFGIQSQAKYVKFYSDDGVYTDSLTLEQAKMEDIMVALLIDGRPIPYELGGPVRLVVPKMYAYKSVKWLNGIELIGEDHVGYWEQRGYDKDAWLPGALS
jgi:DMSO/TMAO reductase YedYZ molybdopterin-dependent catalytic subunit